MKFVDGEILMVYEIMVGHWLFFKQFCHFGKVYLLGQLYIYSGAPKLLIVYNNVPTLNE